MSMHIRLATPADAQAIAAIYEPFVRHTVISFEAEPPTSDAMAERIRSTLKQFPWLVSERAGTVIGYAYASSHLAYTAYQWSVNGSIYLHPSGQRQGIGRKLYTTLFAILGMQGYYNIYAGITLPNPASVALHEALGFENVGVYEQIGFKHGQWLSVGWWHRTLQSHSPDPQPPRPWFALPESLLAQCLRGPETA